MGTLRPGGRKGLAQDYLASLIILPKAQRGCSDFQGAGTQELPVCRYLPWPLLPSAIPGSQPRVTGCVWPSREPTTGYRPRGEPCARIPRQANTFLLGCHCATLPSRPMPPNTVPIVCPRHLELPLSPASDTCPGAPVPRWGWPLDKPKHPCPGPWPLRVAVPFTLKPSKDQRGEVTCATSHRVPN